MAPFLTVVSFGEFFRSKFELVWTHEASLAGSQVIAPDGVFHNNSVLSPFELGKDYHIGIVFARHFRTGVKRLDSPWEIRIYKQDAKTGRTIKKLTIPLNQNFSFKGFRSPFLHLGCSLNYPQGDAAPSASYNELRIWNRELSESELSKNAVRFYKAGETAKTK